MSRREWTDEQLDAVWNEVLDGSDSEGPETEACRMLLTARERAEKAEALVATLKAECRAWRDRSRAIREFGAKPDLVGSTVALTEARAATDAALGKEWL